MKVQEMRTRHENLDALEPLGADANGGVDDIQWENRTEVGLGESSTLRNDTTATAAASALVVILLLVVHAGL